MKLPITLVFTALVALSGCTPNPGPIKALNFYDPSQIGCAPPKDTDIFLYAGQLDVAVGAEFYLGAVVESLINTAGQSGALTLSDGTILEAAGRDAPIIDNILVTYSSKPKQTGFKDLNIPVHALFDTSGSVAEARLGAFNVIGPEAALALDALQPSTDPNDGLDLTVTIHFQGFMSRQGNRIDSGPNPFPIRVRRSMNTCSSAKAARRSFSCLYPGQSSSTSAVGDYCCDKGTATCGDFGSAGCQTTPGCH